MRGRLRQAVGLVAVMVLLPACASGTGGAAGDSDDDGRTTVRVAAAADLKFAFDEIADLTRDRHPEIDLETVYGSSGTFLQQIRNGAPFDLYLSADLEYPRALVAAGEAAEEDLFPYAVGRLVLWVPDASSLEPGDGLGILAEESVDRVAIANPEHAPYGVAAVEALRGASVWSEVRPKLVLGENVAQAAEFVHSGNADAGIVALSLVLSDPLRESGAWAELPLAAYPRLDQGGVVLAGARDADAARAVRDVLLSEAGTDVLARYGFSLPAE